MAFMCMLSVFLCSVDAKGRMRGSKKVVIKQQGVTKELKSVDSRGEWYDFVQKLYSENQKESTVGVQQMQQKIADIKRKNSAAWQVSAMQNLVIKLRVMQPFRYVNYSDELRAAYGDKHFDSFVVVPAVYDVDSSEVVALGVYTSIDYDSETRTCKVSYPCNLNVRIDTSELKAFVATLDYDAHPIAAVTDDGFILKQGIVNSHLVLTVSKHTLQEHPVRVGVVELPIGEDFVELAGGTPQSKTDALHETMRNDSTFDDLLF